jgi:hypothetical protein
MLLDGDGIVLPIGRLEALWCEHRDRLLAAWVRERSGSRPWAWWRFNAPEPRRLLSGRGVLLEQRWRGLRVPLHRGLPTFDSIDETDPPKFESEAAYLERLGLLEPDERERLGQSAFLPEVLTPDGDTRDEPD